MQFTAVYLGILTSCLGCKLTTCPLNRIVTELDAFKSWLALKGRHKNTIALHTKKLRVILSEVEVFSLDNLRTFLVKLKEAGRANATVNHYIDTIRLYTRFRELPIDVSQLFYQRVDPGIKSVLTDTEIEAFLTLECPTGMKAAPFELDTLFFACVAYSGCRPGEIAVLTCADITDKHYLIRTSKTHKPRLVPIADNIRERVLEHKSRVKTGHLFLTSRGRVYSDHNWLHAFNKRIRLLGIDRRGLTPNSFRHSMATELYRRKVPAQIISKLLGNSVNMVEKTYAHMVIDDVEEALRQHPTIGKKSNPRRVIDDLIKDIARYRLYEDGRFKYHLNHGTGRLSLEITWDDLSI